MCRERWKSHQVQFIDRMFASRVAAWHAFFSAQIPRPQVTISCFLFDVTRLSQCFSTFLDVGRNSAALTSAIIFLGSSPSSTGNAAGPVCVVAVVHCDGRRHVRTPLGSFVRFSALFLVMALAEGFLEHFLSAGKIWQHLLFSWSGSSAS